jgi:hypothetical protein
LAADISAVSLGELIHKVPYLNVGIICDFPIFIFSPAVFNTNYHYPAAHSAADFFFSAHARAEPAGNLERFILIQTEIITKREKNRLRAIITFCKFGNRFITSIHDSSFFTPKTIYPF